MKFKWKVDRKTLPDGNVHLRISTRAENEAYVYRGELVMPLNHWLAIRRVLRRGELIGLMETKKQ